jgi:hypothetical protein
MSNPTTFATHESWYTEFKTESLRGLVKARSLSEKSAR